MILLPIKNTATAKQRLASVLDQCARTQLAQAMLTDVLTTLRNWANCPGVAVKPRAWSGLKPSCPVSTTVNPQPGPGVPNCASGREIVMVLSGCSASTNGVPIVFPEASFHTGGANPCTSTSWLQAPAGAMA